MESKDVSVYMHVMSGQSGGAYGYVLHTQRRVAGLSRALCFVDPSGVSPLPNKDQAKTGEISGGITGKITGEKALFRGIKRLNYVEIFRPEKITKKRCGRRGTKDRTYADQTQGISQGAKSPVPEAQVIESAADFGVENFSPIFTGRNMRIGARFGRRKGVGANLDDRHSPVPFHAQRDDAVHFGPEGQGVEFFEREPARLRGIGSGHGRAGEHPGAVIDQHEMVVGRARLGIADRLGHVDQAEDFDLEARLLADFAPHALDQGLAEFQLAARQAPLAFAGLLGAADEQHIAPAVPDDGRDAQHNPACNFGRGLVHSVSHGPGAVWLSMKPVEFNALGSIPVSSRYLDHPGPGVLTSGASHLPWMRFSSAGLQGVTPA